MMRFKRGKFYTIVCLLVIICGLIVLSPIIPFGNNGDDAVSDTEDPIVPPIIPPPDEGDDEEVDFNFTNAYQAINYAKDLMHKNGYYTKLTSTLSVVGDKITFFVNGFRKNDIKTGKKFQQIKINSKNSIPFVTADVDYRFLNIGDVVGISESHLNLNDYRDVICDRLNFSDYKEKFKMSFDDPLIKLDRSTTIGSPTFNRYPGYYKINASLNESSYADYTAMISKLFDVFVELRITVKSVTTTINISKSGNLTKVVTNLGCDVVLDCTKYGNFPVFNFSGNMQICEDYYSASTSLDTSLHDQYYTKYEVAKDAV